MFNTQDLYIININFPEESSDGFYNEPGIYPVSKLLSEMLAFSEKWQGNYYKGSWEFQFLTTLKELLSKENLKKFSIQLPTTDDQRLNAITDRLRNQLHEKLTLENTAKESGMSVRSLTRLFQTKLHITFIQYIKC
ncbi:AraC family transcriptional regulator [Chryseobacterium gleum]|uniref:AraC family transcriptional regulator n=1 Tax=Chryseobacterium gleum TaxID=250 RepID=UPI00241F5A85|nr:AraC family transcriptional regulator [Chryseobacterium gleum]